MRDFILLLPILFIIHDMEEIVGFERFFRKNPWVYERYPKITKAYRNFATAGMAAAVYEEFIPFFGISLLTFYFPNKILYTVWFALMLSLAVHFVIHIVLCIYIRKYIPSLITSIICLPVCALILYKCIPMMPFNLLTSVLTVITAVLMMLNLRFAHWMMYRYNKKNELWGRG